MRVSEQSTKIRFILFIFNKIIIKKNLISHVITPEEFTSYSTEEIFTHHLNHIKIKVGLLRLYKHRFINQLIARVKT